ncbi:plasmid maintenance protein [Borrelia turicatae]|uniref:plasmid maintenance protein n=1 Tax=Borrelia turicatae TaxID=142 RepID=UPI002ED5A088
MKNTKKPTNKYQHKLIVLISTLNYINLNLEQYTQSDILYYFNNNMKRNGQKPVKLKTLQSYLYKLKKEFKITINYHRHLGVNMGTEIYYELKYSKKECYCIINKLFRDKKVNGHKNRVNEYFKKTHNQNSNVEKWECSYNIYNNKEKKKDSKFIERLQVKKYAKKCNFKLNNFYFILDLKISKKDKIKLLRILKISENSTHTKINSTKTNKSKQKELSKILREIKTNLENEGYNNKQLETQIQSVYEKYKSKPHFIVEKDKYSDLKKIIERLKNTVEHVKTIIKENEKCIRNNVFSILLDQLRYKVDISILVPILKDYLSKQDKLEYSKVFSNHYYYELLKLVRSDGDATKLEKSEKITS